MEKRCCICFEIIIQKEPSELDNDVLQCDELLYFSVCFCVIILFRLFRKDDTDGDDDCDNDDGNIMDDNESGCWCGRLVFV